MKDDTVYLRHILDAVSKIESYVAVGRDTFMTASHWQDAVIRQLEIVGRQPRTCPESSVRVTPIFPGGALPGCAISSFTNIWAFVSQQYGRSPKPTCQS